MIIETTIRSESDDTVVAVVRSQEAGRVSLSEVLHALQIEKKDWKDTFLQLVITKLPRAGEEIESEGF